jgi:hypothetical protein
MKVFRGDSSRGSTDRFSIWVHPDSERRSLSALPTCRSSLLAETKPAPVASSCRHRINHHPGGPLLTVFSSLTPLEDLCTSAPQQKSKKLGDSRRTGERENVTTGQGASGVYS